MVIFRIASNFRRESDSGRWSNLTVKEDFRLYGIETSYLMKLSIGSPPRRFHVIVDTGSCDFWITDHSCSDFECRYKEKYHLQNSRTGKGPFEAFSINYLDSSIKGRLFQDHVSIGQVEARNLYFGGAMEMRGVSLVGDNFDGIIGLCPRSSRARRESLLETLYQQEQISHRIFSIWLPPEPAQTGRLTLGRIAEERTDTEVYWFNIEPGSKWKIPLKSFEFDGKRFIRGKAAAAFDSGSTNIHIPSRAFKVIHDRLNARFSEEANAYEVRCEDVSSFPTISIVLGNLRLSLEPEQYIITQERGCYTAFEERNLTKHGAETWIFGCPFMRAYFTAYDLDNGRFGIAIPTKRIRTRPGACKIGQ